MHYFLRLLFLIALCMNFLACKSTVSSERSDHDKKIAAAKVNIQLGMAYLERKDMQRARQKLVLALDQAPSLPESWYAMGYFLESTGGRMDANRYYLKSVSLAPERGDVLNNYGTYLCRAGKYEMSINYFMRAVKDKTYLDPSSAYENAGFCAMKIPNMARAQFYFNRALEENPARYTSILGLAETYYYQKKYVLSREKLNEFLNVSAPTVQSFLLEKKLDKLKRVI